MCWGLKDTPTVSDWPDTSQRSLNYSKNWQKLQSILKWATTFCRIQIRPGFWGIPISCTTMPCRKGFIWSENSNSPAPHILLLVHSNGSMECVHLGWGGRREHDGEGKQRCIPGRNYLEATRTHVLFRGLFKCQRDIMGHKHTSLLKEIVWKAVFSRVILPPPPTYSLKPPMILPLHWVCLLKSSPTSPWVPWVQGWHWLVHHCALHLA